MSGRILAAMVVLGLALLGSCAPAMAQSFTSPEERFFAIDWQVDRTGGRDAAIVGFLNNHYLYSLHRVQLQVDVLDPSGQVTHEAFAYLSDIAPGARGGFRVILPAPGARYAVTVHAFEFGSRESP